MILRKPRPFAGMKGRSIVDFCRAASGAESVTDIAQISYGDPRYNTQAHALQKNGMTKTIVWYRLSLEEVFERIPHEPDAEVIALFRNQPLPHPIPSNQLLDILNGAYFTDFEPEDIDVVQGSSNNEYILRSKPSSFGYVGEVTLTLTEEYNIELWNAPPVTEWYRDLGENCTYRIWQNSTLMAEGKPDTLVDQVRLKNANFEVQVSPNIPIDL